MVARGYMHTFRRMAGFGTSREMGIEDRSASRKGESKKPLWFQVLAYGHKFHFILRKGYGLCKFLV